MRWDPLKTLDLQLAGDPRSTLPWIGETVENEVGSRSISGRSSRAGTAANDWHSDYGLLNLILSRIPLRVCRNVGEWLRVFPQEPPC